MARAILTDAERLAWERFPAESEPDVIGAFFTLADGEVDALRRLPTPTARLASAVALAGIRWLGFVPAELDQAPTAGVARLAGQLDVDPDALASYVPAERTAREHRQRAAQLARFRDPVRRTLTRWRNCWSSGRSSTTRRSHCCAPRSSRCATASCCVPRCPRSSGWSPPPVPVPSATRSSVWRPCSTGRRGGRLTRCA